MILYHIVLYHTIPYIMLHYTIPSYNQYHTIPYDILYLHSQSNTQHRTNGNSNTKNTLPPPIAPSPPPIPPPACLPAPYQTCPSHPYLTISPPSKYHTIPHYIPYIIPYTISCHTYISYAILCHALPPLQVPHHTTPYGHSVTAPTSRSTGPGSSWPSPTYGPSEQRTRRKYIIGINYMNLYIYW